MDKSHEDFVKQVLTCTREFPAEHIKAFVEGDAEDATLSKAFEAWSKGDGSQMLRVLNPKEWTKRQSTSAEATPV